MSSHLRLQGRSPLRDPLDLGPTLGTFGDVKATVEMFFPEVEWISYGRGESDCESLFIEFDIHGDPVEDVSIRVRSGDPSQILFAMADKNKWDVVNEDCGNFLEEDVTPDWELISRLQKAAVVTLESGKSQKGNAALPRIKSQHPLSELEPAWKIERLFFIQLNNDETPRDIVNRYLGWVETQSLGSDYARFMFGTTELQLPDGRRFAAFNYRYAEYSSDKQGLTEFARDIQVATACAEGDRVMVSDGKSFGVDACRLIERARKRKQ